MYSLATIILLSAWLQNGCDVKKALPFNNEVRLLMYVGSDILYTLVFRG